MNEITLDYVETTGLHTRVGLIGERRILEDAEEGMARDLAGLLVASCWDINWTGPNTVEVSFEGDE